MMPRTVLLCFNAVLRITSTQQSQLASHGKVHLAGESIDGLTNGSVKGVEILLGASSTSRNRVDDGKGYLIDNVLKAAEDGGDDASHRCPSEKALLSNDDLEKLLVDLDELP